MRISTWGVVLCLLPFAGCGGCHDEALETADAGLPDAATELDAAGPALAVTLEHDALTVPLDIGVEVDVTLTRNGLDGDVVIDAIDVPAGVTVEPLTILDGATVGTLVFHVDAEAAAATAALTVRATLPGHTAEDTMSVTLDPLAPVFHVAWDGWGVRDRGFWTRSPWVTPTQFETRAANGYAGYPMARFTGLPPEITAPDVTVDLFQSSSTTTAATLTTGVVDPGIYAGSLIVSDGTLRDTIPFDVRVTVGVPGLDPTFGSGGMVAIDPTGWAGYRPHAIPVGIAIDADGQVVIAGEMMTTAFRLHLVVTRLTAAGALDTTFGTAGLGAIHGDGSIHASDMAMTSSGITVLGRQYASTSNGVVVARFTGAGAIDTTFGGGDGLVTITGLPTYGNPRVLALASDDDLVIAGDDTTPYVARLLADGSVDPTFAGGVAMLDDVGPAQVHDVAIDSSGRIVVVGVANPFAETETVIVVRLLATGTLDPAFGTGGVVTFDPVVSEQVGLGALRIAILADDTIVVAGSASVSYSTGAAFVAKFDHSGAPVGSFGAAGVQLIHMDSRGLEGLGIGALAAGPAGIDVVASRSELGGTAPYPVTFHLAPDGTLDTSVGTVGFDWLLDAQVDEFAAVAATSTADGTWMVARGNASEPRFLLMKQAP